MKKRSLPDGSPSRPILVIIIVVVAVVLVIAGFSGMAGSQGVQIISASPGQTITYQGHGSPGSQVTLEVSSTISVGVSNGHYISRMNGVNIPGGSRFSINARPVDTLTVSGSPNWAGGLGYSLQGSVNNHAGSASMNNVPGGTYNILVSGIANGSGPVSVTVHAYQPQSVGGDGTFTASISTSGLPSAVYAVRQDGAEVATVYLGVDAPATPTPEPTATPTPVPSPDPTANITVTPVPIVSPSPTPGIWISPTPTAQPGGGSFLGIQWPSINLFGSPSTQPPGISNASGTEPAGVSGGNNSLLNTILVLIIAVIVGLVIGYVIVFVILKW